MDSATISRRWVLGACLAGAFALSAVEGSLSYALVESWLTNAVPLMLLALSAGLLISCGRIDISSGAAMSTVGMIVVSMYGFFGGTIAAGVWAHIAAVAYLALLYCLYHMVTKAGVPAIIATLSGLLISKGISTIIQACVLGAGQICRSSNFGIQGTVIREPTFIAAVLDTLLFNLLFIALVVAAFGYWRYRARSGLEHVAVGMNETAAGYARIEINRVRALAFGLAALLVFLATLLRLHGQNNGGWAPNTGWGEELIAIAIAVIGGTRVSGGHFDPLAIGFASVTVYVWRDIITNDVGVPTEATSMLFGVLLIAITWLDLRRSRQRIAV